MSLEEIQNATLSVRDIARLVGVPHTTVKGWIWQGLKGKKLPIIKKGRSAYTSPEIVTAYLAEHNRRTAV